MASKYVYRPLSEIRSTRVLLLEPHANREAALRCTLEEIVLDAANEANAPYNALSYVWGATTGTRSLLCSGAEILITPNCESALRYLRHKKKIVRLWIDALCIDQNNITEKEAQVSMMGSIYRRASKVFIWLGEGNDAIAKCFSRIQLLSPCWDFIGDISDLLLKLRRFGRKSLARRTFSLLAADISVQDLAEIFRNNWAKRVWTIQEHALASNPIVKYGNYETSFEQFYWFHICVMKLALETLDSREDCVSMINNIQGWENRYRASLSMNIISEDEDANVYLSRRGKAGLMITAIYLSQANNCSNPLDKVYAVYSIVISSLKCRPEELPPVSYTKDKTELYAEFTKATIRAIEKFWPASMFYWRSEPTSDLPSWVPELERSFNQIGGLQNSLNELVSTTYVNIKTSLDSTVVIQTLQHPVSGSLVIKGISFATVETCGKRLPSVSEDIYTAFPTLISWWAMLCAHLDRDTMSENRHRNEENFLQDLQCVLLSFFPEHFRSKVETEVNRFFDWVRIRQQESLRVDRIQVDSRTHSMDAELAQYVKDQNSSLFQRWGSWWADFILFITSTGHLGITIGHIEEGDTIAIFAGSDRPVVLRRLESGNWRYIGSAYIHRIMSGEAWPADKSAEELETFVLV